MAAILIPLAARSIRLAARIRLPATEPFSRAGTGISTRLLAPDLGLAPGLPISTRGAAGAV